MLPPADKAEEYASFLSESIRQHLDDEWIEQDCHKGIGEEAAKLYLAAFQKVCSGCISLRSCYDSFVAVILLRQL